jgi:hypothetical protein
MWEFATLPSEGEFEEWVVKTVFAGKEAALDRVLKGFKYLNIDAFRKRFLLTFDTREQAEELLTTMETHGPRGVLWPGLDTEVRVRASSMDETIMEIVVLDVAPETDEELVRQALEKYGKVKRCERMRLQGGRFSKVKVNKVKVEMVRNQEVLPNVIHAFGTAASAEDFLTWKMQYRGCPRYCYGCGATSHEARQCREQGFTREELERVRSVVGEEEQTDDEALEDQEVPKLSYAAVVKDRTFLAKQRQERMANEAKKAAEAIEQDKGLQEQEHLARAEETLLQQREAVKLAQAKVLRETKEGEQQQQQQGSQKKLAVEESGQETENRGDVLKRPAPAPTSPSPKEKAARVGSESGESGPAAALDQGSKGIDTILHNGSSRSSNTGVIFGDRSFDDAD